MTSLFLYLSSSNYTVELVFASKHVKFNEYFYGYCSSINELINTFYYARGKMKLELVNEQEWIFLLRDLVKSPVINRIPEKIVKIYLPCITDFGRILNKFRIQLRSQLKLETSLYHQKIRYDTAVLINKERCKLDSRFISESINTTNRIHKQRLKHLEEKVEKFPNKVTDLLDIYYRFEWLIFTESSTISKGQASIQTFKTKSTDIISQAWETVIQSEEDTLNIDSCTTR